MTIKFTTTKEQESGTRVLIYGNPGVGKTKLCATLDAPLIVSAEKNLLCLQDEDIPVIEVNTADDMFGSFDFIQQSADAAQFKNICLDSVTDMAEIMLAEYKKEFTDARQAYGKLAHEFEQLLRRFRDELPGKNLYCTCKMGNVTDELSGIIKYAPVMPGKYLTGALPYFFNEVLVMRVQQDEAGSYRYIQTNSDVQYIAKDSSGRLDDIEPPNLGLIFDKIVGGTPIKEVALELPKHEPEQGTETDQEKPKF